MRGRRAPKPDRMAKTRSRRAWERRAAASLRRRHREYSEQREDDLLAQKIRERRFRGKSLPRATQRELQRRVQRRMR